MIRKNRTSKLAIGALLACQIGSISATTNAGLFSGVIDSIKENLSISLSVFRTNPSAALPIIYQMPAFFKWMWSLAVKGCKFVADSFIEVGTLYDEKTMNIEVKKAYAESGVSSEGFKMSYKELLLALKGIARRKEIIKSSSGSQEPNFILISGVKSPLRKKIVENVCSSIYSKDFLTIDLTKHEDKSLSSIVDILFPVLERQPSWIRSYSDEEEDVDTSRSGISEYISNKNSEGVVRILVTPKLLRTLDPLISAFIEDPEADGKITYKGKSVRLDSITVVLEVKEDNVGSGLHFLDKSPYVKFPEKMERVELEHLVNIVFYKSFAYYSEKFGFNASFDRLSKSICDVLKKNQRSATEPKMNNLAKDFTLFLDKNERKLVNQKKYDIVYNVKEGGFSFVSKVRKTRNGRTRQS